MEIHQQIFQESFKLFHQYGIKSVSMDDIAKKLSISKKTLYKHFSNKQDLVYQIVSHQAKSNESDCICVTEKSDNAIHELMLMMITLREMFKGMNPSLLFDLQKFYPKAWKIIEEQQDIFVKQMIFKNLKQGVEEGLYRSDINENILAELRLEEIKLTFNTEVFKGHAMEDVQICLLEHFMMGITTIKGHKLANEYKNKINE
jgi:AcrR family transcriptional regulator